MTREEREVMWRERIAAQAASGSSGRMWCEREEVSYWRLLIQWRLHVGRETAGERPLRFLPVRADAAAARIRIGAAVIEVASGLIQACCGR